MKEKKSRIPFGTALISITMIAKFFGPVVATLSTDTNWLINAILVCDLGICFALEHNKEV